MKYVVEKMSKKIYEEFSYADKAAMKAKHFSDILSSESKLPEKRTSLKLICYRTSSSESDDLPNIPGNSNILSCQLFCKIIHNELIPSYFLLIW